MGQALRRLPLGTRIPWQRIINASFAISSRGDGGSGAQQQASRLQEEGVSVTQDAMGVWKVSRGTEWEMGGAQLLEDLLHAEVEEDEEEEDEEGEGEDEGEEEAEEGEQGADKPSKTKRKKGKKQKSGKKQKREKQQVVVKNEDGGEEEGVQ